MMRKSLGKLGKLNILPFSGAARTWSSPLQTESKIIDAAANDITDHGKTRNYLCFIHESPDLAVLCVNIRGARSQGIGRERTIFPEIEFLTGNFPFAIRRTEPEESFSSRPSDPRS